MDIYEIAKFSKLCITFGVRTCEFVIMQNLLMQNSLIVFTLGYFWLMSILADRLYTS